MADDVLERWMRLEMRSIAESLVRVPRPLDELLKEREPTAPTAGEPHRYDPQALRRLAARLPWPLHGRLRLPMRFYVHHEHPGDAYVADPPTIEALQAIRPGVGPREGKLWWGLPLARDLAAEFPTLVQFVFT